MQELTCCALIFYIVVSQVAFITVFNDSSQVSGRVVGARGGAAPAMPGRGKAAPPPMPRRGMVLLPTCHGVASCCSRHATPWHGAPPAMPGMAPLPPCHGPTARVASEADEEASSEATRALGVSAHASCEATGVLGFHFQGFNIDSPRFPGV